MDGLLPSLSDVSLVNSTTPLVDELLDEVDLERCQLLGPFALVIQAVMGLVVLGGLVLKRMRERPRRKWKIWLADVSKQIVGQAFVHASNVAISDLIANHTSDNPCSLYALNILVDTTLGVLLLYYLLHFSTQLMQQYRSPTYNTGFYGTPFSLALWGEQAAVYVACLAAMKLVVVVLFWAIPQMEDLVSWALSWITNDQAQVFVVMLVLPLVMNLFQFLTVDSFLKSKDPPASALVDQSDEEALRRGFLEAEEDGDETYSDNEDGGGRSRRGSHRTEEENGFVDDYGDEVDEVDRRRGNGSAGNGSSGAQSAEQGLLDAEEGNADSLPARAMHSYPPQRAASLRSTTSSLPPYSSVPPPGAHPSLAQQQQRQQKARDSNERPRRSMGTEDDEDWDRDWAGSDDEEAAAPHSAPAAAGAPTEAAHFTSPGLPSSAFPPLSASTAPAQPPPPARTPSPVFRSISPAPTTPTSAPAPPAHQPSPVAAKPAALSFAAVAAAPPAVEEDEPEGEDDWGFGDDDADAEGAEELPNEVTSPRLEEEKEEQPALAPAVERAPSLPPPPPRARTPTPPPPAVSAAPSLPSSIPSTPPSARTSEPPAPPPRSPSPPPPPVLSGTAPAGPPAPEPPAEPEDEDDDWGFGSASPAVPESVGVMSPPLAAAGESAVVEEEEQRAAEPVERIEEEQEEELSEKEPLEAASEKSAAPESAPASPAGGDGDEEEDDDWGFDESPSLTAESELRSEVDRIIGLKKGEKVATELEAGGEKLPPPVEVGKALDVGGLS
ncbi:hypothetical protein JCM8097_006669 [Rhodosporidiobolus ruineniae]